MDWVALAFDGFEVALHIRWEEDLWVGVVNSWFRVAIRILITWIPFIALRVSNTSNL